MAILSIAINTESQAIGVAFTEFMKSVKKKNNAFDPVGEDEDTPASLGNRLRFYFLVYADLCAPASLQLDRSQLTPLHILGSGDYM